MLKLGIDTGGTFTDFVLQTPEGIRTWKTPSTPANPARAIREGIRHFFPELPPELEIVHGTTVGTNGFLERKGARTALITTAGFEDVLFIGRQTRERLYDLGIERQAPIIPRSFCRGVRERMRWDGSIQLPLARTAGRRLREFCRRKQVEAVAVCLLHAYANPTHEQRLKEELASLGVPVTISSELLPEFREYERLTTSLINAYLAPVITSYIEELAAGLPGIPLSIQQSNGGILPAAGIADRAVHTVLSGPAGGVHGADALAREMGLGKIITFDMGGTSTDVSLCDGGPLLTRDYRLDGYPVRVQVIDIHTVGAGGGSLARVDAGGLLRVGPASAGAEPGPVCYGRGEELTVTDANLYLGRLLPDRFLDGEMRLDRERVAFYLDRLAGEAGLVPEETALGIVRVVNAGMAKAIRAVSLERGHNPREFALFAFGGAAGLHCCELAAELGIGKVVVPARAGILSAQGMVFAEQALDFVQALFLSGSAIGPPLLDEAVARLERKALAEVGRLCREGSPEVRHFLDLRYEGQSFELTIPFRENFRERFHQAHEQAFGYALENTPLELVSIRCTVRLRRKQQPLPRCRERVFSPPVPQGETMIHFREGEKRVPVFERSGLLPGHRLAGPALILDDYTTILLPAGSALEVDPLLNLVIENQGRGGESLSE